MKELKDYILVVPSIVPLELCNSIISEYKNCDDWTNALIASGENLQMRNCQTIGLSCSSVIEKNQTTRQQIDQELFNCASKAIKEYKNSFSYCYIERDYGYSLLKYSNNCFYRSHVDSAFNSPRAVSCSFALNDDYEGGEFAFFNRELEYKIPKGAALMFPSNFMYPHEVMPVTSGTRYSIVTWFI